MIELLDLIIWLKKFDFALCKIVDIELPKGKKLAKEQKSMLDKMYVFSFLVNNKCHIITKNAVLILERLVWEMNVIGSHVFQMENTTLGCFFIEITTKHFIVLTEDRRALTVCNCRMTSILSW